MHEVYIHVKSYTYVYDHTKNLTAYPWCGNYAIVQAGHCSGPGRVAASLERGPVRATFEVHNGLQSTNVCIGTIHERIAALLMQSATLKLCNTSHTACLPVMYCGRFISH